MNFRVHLQYEFSQLGLDDYLEKLRNTESEELQVGFLKINFYVNYRETWIFHSALKVQISAYLDNVFDVQGLVSDLYFYTHFVHLTNILIF